MTRLTNENEMGVAELARRADLSEVTIHRWKNDPDNAGGLPLPIRRPGKPAAWSRVVVEDWLRTYQETRTAEAAMHSLATCDELDPILRRVAGVAGKLLADASIPLSIRSRLDETLRKIRWSEAKGATLTERDKFTARKALLHLLAFSGPTGDEP